MDNVSFQGRTNLILNPKKYNEITPGIFKKSQELGHNNKCTLQNGQVYTAKPDAGNLVVIVRNKDKGFLKYVPVELELDEITEEIARRVTKLAETAKSKLTAWIIGGGAIKSRTGGSTIEAVNKLAEVLCDRPDIDTSIIACAKKPEENIILHPLKDRFELTLEKNKSTNIEDAFDIVELNNTNII